MLPWSSDMLDEVKELRKGPHRLWVRFADGMEGIVDLSSLSGRGMFAPLVDQAFFARASVDDSGAVCWPNSADLVPNAMHGALRVHGYWRPEPAKVNEPV